MVKNVNVKTYDESVKPKYYAIKQNLFLFPTCTVREIKGEKYWKNQANAMKEMKKEANVVGKQHRQHNY